MPTIDDLATRAGQELVERVDTMIDVERDLRRLLASAPSARRPRGRGRRTAVLAAAALVTVSVTATVLLRRDDHRVVPVEPPPTSPAPTPPPTPPSTLGTTSPTTVDSTLSTAATTPLSSSVTSSLPFDSLVIRPATTRPVGADPPWAADFARAQANTGPGDVGDGAIAFDTTDALYELVNTSTDQVIAPGNGIVHAFIGGVAAGRDGIVYATSSADVRFEMRRYDGTLVDYPPIDYVNSGPARVAATIGADDTVYAVLQDLVSSDGPALAPLARVYRLTPHSVVQLAPTAYGQPTIAADGTLRIISDDDPSLRAISRDGGNTWTQIRAVSGTFTKPSILYGLSDTASVAFDASNPHRIGTVASDGTVTNEIDVADENIGWTAVDDPRDPAVHLIGRSSGARVDIDRTTGRGTVSPLPAFDLAGGFVEAAWRGPTELHALAAPAGCTQPCPLVVLDEVTG